MSTEIVKDPELLRALKPIWRTHGCAFCGRTVPEEGTDAGFDIELAHVMGRGMGGGRRRDVADNILGLCGGLAPNQCHPRFDRHDIGIFTNTAHDECWEVKHGDPLLIGDRHLRNGPVRRLRPGALEERVDSRQAAPRSPGALLHGALAAQRGEASGALPFGEKRLEPGPTPFRDVLAAQNGVPAVVEHADTPEGRHILIRRLVVEAERNRIAAALLLLKAWEDREYEALNRSWPEYYQEVGLGKSEVSKMLRVAATFRGMLNELPAADAGELSLERAYYAARLVREEVMSHTDALAAAVSTPSSGLVALLKGDEPADRCVCSNCGNNHVRRAQEAAQDA